MRFIYTGQKWINCDKIRDVEINRGDKPADKERMEEAKKKGLEICDTEVPGMYYVTMFRVMITMDDGEWEEYDPFAQWKTREEAEETAIRLIKKLEDR